MASRQTPIYERLVKDHELVKDILAKMASTSSRATKERLRLFGKLKKELIAHAHAEENVLYHALERHKEAKSIALEGEEEHHVAENLLLDIEQTDPADDHWLAKVTVLKEILEHHIEEEEDELFTQAQDILDDEQAIEIGQQFEQQKMQEQQRL